MPLPTITHLQFLVLSALLEGELSGRQLRDALKKQGAKKTLAAFYQLMARLEDAGLVTSRSETGRVEGVTITTRYYTITASGERAEQACIEFYAAEAGGRLLGGLTHG